MMKLFTFCILAYRAAAPPSSYYTVYRVALLLRSCAQSSHEVCSVSVHGPCKTHNFEQAGDVQSVYVRLRTYTDSLVAHLIVFLVLDLHSC
jgi:hypothetical protein